MQKIPQGNHAIWRPGIGPRLRRFGRRRLLQGTALGGTAIVGVAAAGRVAAATTQSTQPLSTATSAAPDLGTATNPIGAKNPIPFYAGVVSETTNNKQVTITKADQTTVTVPYASDTSFWKGSDGIDPSVVELGDIIYLRGFPPDSNGTVMADRVWLNIAWVRGVITAIDNQTASVHSNRRNLTGTVTWDTATALFQGSTADTPSSISPSLGQYIEALGVISGPASISATRVWLYPAAQAQGA